MRLGAACLELHSNRTNKKTIIEELRRTALGERHAIPQARGELSLLADARDRLNAYCRAVNEPIGASGDTPCTAYGRLLNAQTSLNGLDLPAISLEGAVGWTAEDVARRAQLVAQLQDRVTRSGVPIRHSFWGSQLKILLPTDRDEIRKLRSAPRRLCGPCGGGERAGADVFRRSSPNGPGSRDAVSIGPTSTGSSRSSGGRPKFSGVAPGEQSIRQALAAGARHRELHRQYGKALRPEAWGTGTSELRRNVAGLRWSLVAIAFQPLAAHEEVSGRFVYVGAAT